MVFTLGDAAFRQTKAYKDAMAKVKRAMELCRKVNTLEDESIALEALSFATFKAMKVIRQKID